MNRERHLYLWHDSQHLWAFYKLWIYTNKNRYRRVPLTDAASNNGMHPTANSAALIENSCGFEVGCAAGDAGRYAALLSKDAC